MVFLWGVDHTRNGKFVEELYKLFLKRKGYFPKTVSVSYSLIINYMNFMTYTHNIIGYGLKFASMYIGNMKNKSGLNCFTCGKMGHYSKDFPKNSGVWETLPPIFPQWW